MKKKRYGRLKYAIHELEPGESLEQAFPVLFQHKAFARFKGPKRDMIIAYVIYLYDPGSDLYEEFDDLADRKDAAAVEAGFKRNEKGEWPKAIKDVMTFKNQEARAMILQYLIICNNNVWQEMQIVEEELYRLNAMRLEPLPELKNKDSADLYAKRDKLMEMSEKRVEVMGLLKKQFYADNADLVKTVEEEPISPENVLRILEIEKMEY